MCSANLLPSKKVRIALSFVFMVIVFIVAVSDEQVATTSRKFDSDDVSIVDDRSNNEENNGTDGGDIGENEAEFSDEEHENGNKANDSGK